MLTIKYFTAPAWCGPCKMFGPTVEKVQIETGANIQKIDVDNNKDIAINYGIMSVPTLIFERDGVVVNKRTGVCSHKELVTMIERS
jgi:thioredoxin 1